MVNGLCPMVRLRPRIMWNRNVGNTSGLLKQSQNMSGNPIMGWGRFYRFQCVLLNENYANVRVRACKRQIVGRPPSCEILRSFCFAIRAEVYRLRLQRVNTARFDENYYIKLLKLTNRYIEYNIHYLQFNILQCYLLFCRLSSNSRQALDMRGNRHNHKH